MSAELESPRPRRRVLLVDDAPDERLLLRVQLELLGVEFSEAASGKEALLLCDGDPFDLVVLDQRMPGMSGIEVAKRLREERCPTPIILYTNHPSPGLQNEAGELDIPVIEKREIERLADAVAG